MSTMKELYKKVAADTMLQEKVGKIFEVAGDDADAAGEKLVEFAKEQGYDVTVAEISEFFKSMSEASKDQLSEEELDAVAGGKSSGGGAIFITAADSCIKLTVVTAVTGPSIKISF